MVVWFFLRNPRIVEMYRRTTSEKIKEKLEKDGWKTIFTIYPGRWTNFSDNWRKNFYGLENQKNQKRIR